MVKPVVYYYLWMSPGWQLWRMMFAEQMMAFEESGLAGNCDFRLYVNGLESDWHELKQESVLGLYPWVSERHFRPIDAANKNFYEGWPLSKIWRDAQTEHDPDTPVLYVHGKGSLTMNKCVYQWLKLMEHFCVYRWQDVIPQLTSGDFEAAGALYSTQPQKHFSGNFWWARAGYLKTLPDPLSSGYYTDDSRIKYEMWIGANLAFPLGLHQTGKNHYIDEYPPSRYKGAK